MGRTYLSLFSMRYSSNHVTISSWFLTLSISVQLFVGGTLLNACTVVEPISLASYLPHGLRKEYDCGEIAYTCQTYGMRRITRTMGSLLGYCGARSSQECSSERLWGYAYLAPRKRGVPKWYMWTRGYSITWMYHFIRPVPLYSCSWDDPKPWSWSQCLWPSRNTSSTRMEDVSLTILCCKHRLLDWASIFSRCHETASGFWRRLVFGWAEWNINRPTYNRTLVQYARGGVESAVG